MIHFKRINNLLVKNNNQMKKYTNNKIKKLKINSTLVFIVTIMKFIIFNKINGVIEISKEIFIILIKTNNFNFNRKLNIL